MNNTEAGSFRPPSNSDAPTVDPWKPRQRTFAEILRSKMNKVMQEQGVSASIAEMIVRQKMEMLDDEAILCI